MVLQLHADVDVFLSNSDVNLRPRAKKGRALIAMIALSERYILSRKIAAATLWSSLDRIEGLARLRDTIYHVRKAIGEAGHSIIRVERDTISFVSDLVQVKIKSSTGSNSGQRDPTWDLVNLNNLDPALDRWLFQSRDHSFHDMELGTINNDGLPSASSRVSSQTQRPSVLISNFETIGRTLDEHAGRMLSEEIGSSLARLRWIRTIMQVAPGQDRPFNSEVSLKIADYRLTGFLQQDEEGYRCSLKLTDLGEGSNTVWSASFSGNGPFTIDSQMRVANSAAARLDSELLMIVAERQTSRLVTRKNDAFGLVLQAVPAIYRLEREPFLRAGRGLEQAIAADRDFAMAHSWLAYWHIFLVGQGWASHASQSLTRAGEAANRAIMLDPKDARGVTVAGHVKAFLHRSLDEAATLHELAIQLNPALPLAWHFLGMTHAYAGRLDKAYECITRCGELAPGDPHAFFAEGALGIVHLLQHRHESAVTLGRRVTERHPHFTSAYKSYLAALGHLGQKREAASVLQRLKALEPRFTLHRFRSTAPYQRREDLEHFTSGLRFAGVF